MHPPVKSEPRMLSVSLERLEIQVFLTKLPGMLLANDKEIETIIKVSNPSVNAP